MAHSSDNLFVPLSGRQQRVNDAQSQPLTRTAEICVPLALYVNLNLMLGCWRWWAFETVTNLKSLKDEIEYCTLPREAHFHIHRTHGDQLSAGLCVGQDIKRWKFMETWGGEGVPSPRSLVGACSQLRIKDPNTINVWLRPFSFPSYKNLQFLVISWETPLTIYDATKAP